MERIKVSFGEPVFTHDGMNTVCELNYYLKLDICEGPGGQVTAVAKFNPNDERYDERIGEKVALARAEIKARKEAKVSLLERIKFMKTELSKMEIAVSEIDTFNKCDKESINRILE